MTYAEYRLAYWLEDISQLVSVSSELRSEVHRRFAEQGIDVLPAAALVASDMDLGG